MAKKSIRALKAQAQELGISAYWELTKPELEAAIAQAKQPTPRQQALASLGDVRPKRTPYGTVLVKGEDAIVLAPIGTWPSKFWIVLAARHLGLNPVLHLYGPCQPKKLEDAIAACNGYGILVRTHPSVVICR